jgi:hypothetical protein
MDIVILSALNMAITSTPATKTCRPTPVSKNRLLGTPCRPALERKKPLNGGGFNVVQLENRCGRAFFITEKFSIQKGFPHLAAKLLASDARIST